MALAADGAFSDEDGVLLDHSCECDGGAADEGIILDLVVEGFIADERVSGR